MTATDCKAGERQPPDAFAGVAQHRRVNHNRCCTGRSGDSASAVSIARAFSNRRDGSGSIARSTVATNEPGKSVPAAERSVRPRE